MSTSRPAAQAAHRAGDTASAVIVGMAAVSAFGRGTGPLLAGVTVGEPAFRPVDRFSVGNRRGGVAATLPETPDLLDELATVTEAACQQAGLTVPERSGTTLLLAAHGDPRLGRTAGPDRATRTAAALAGTVAVRCGLAQPKAYTNACVAASTAVADAAAMIALGRADRVVVAAGYLVESDQFALFDAGRALATDGQVRPFSTDRTGLLLGDGVAAVVLEAESAAQRRAVAPLARISGWGRSGDGYHVVQPRPDGAGMARAIRAALDRAGIGPDELGYINAHGSGSAQSDVAESAALHRALGRYAAETPISSTKSLHGQALEASGLLELVVTVLALRAGRLPVNAGYLGPDGDCKLNVVVDNGQTFDGRYALSLNAAFGGANTALLVGAA